MVVTNLNENYETEETMFGVIFSTNLTALRYISITQILFEFPLQLPNTLTEWYKSKKQKDWPIG